MCVQQMAVGAIKKSINRHVSSTNWQRPVAMTFGMTTQIVFLTYRPRLKFEFIKIHDVGRPAI